jgi:hypothetical protein
MATAAVPAKLGLQHELCTPKRAAMTTSLQPHDHQRREPGAEGLMLWLGAAMLAVTVMIIVGITQFEAAVGVAIALGSLLVAAMGVLVYILRFMGSED